MGETGSAVLGGRRRGVSCAAARVDGRGRKRAPDTDRRGHLHEPRQPAQDAGRARLVLARRHGGHGLPDRPRLRRRGEQHRLGDHDERGPHLDDGQPPGDDDPRGRAVGPDQRPGGGLRPRARRLDDLDARVRVCRRAVRIPERHPHEPLDRRRPHVAGPGHDLLRRRAAPTTRTGSPATRGR